MNFYIKKCPHSGDFVNPLSHLFFKLLFVKVIYFFEFALKYDKYNFHPLKVVGRSSVYNLNCVKISEIEFQGLEEGGRNATL